jgi:hypothetical protein
MIDPVSQQLINMQETVGRSDYTNEERAMILAEHAAGVSPEDIAAHLAQSRARAIVDRVIHEQAARVAATPRVEQVYSFLPPPQPPTQEEIANGRRNLIQPVQVKESKLSEFCAANGLDEAAMLAVWNGDLYEHKLWRQRRPGPDSYAAKQHRKEVWEFNRDTRERDEKEAKAYQKRLKAAVTNQSPYADQPAEWTPDQKPAKVGHVQVIRMG